MAAGVIGVHYQNYECFTSSAVVTGGATICSGSSAPVTVTITGGLAPYTVTLTNGGGTLTGNSPLVFNVSPATTTSYSVQSATDANGSRITVNGSATINVNPAPVANPVSPATICSGRYDQHSVDQYARRRDVRVDGFARERNRHRLC